MESSSLFGWCQSHGIPDHKHHACIGSFESKEVTHVCSCPNHENDKKIRRVQRVSRTGAES